MMVSHSPRLKTCPPGSKSCPGNHAAAFVQHGTLIDQAVLIVVNQRYSMLNLPFLTDRNFAGLLRGDDVIIQGKP